MIAASLLLATAAITHFERATSSVELPKPVPIKVAAAAEWKIEPSNEDLGPIVHQKFAFEIIRGGKHRHYVVPIKDWYRDCHWPIPARMPVKGFGGTESGIAGIIASAEEQGCGMHGGAKDETVMVIDCRGEKPRSMSVNAEEVEIMGYVNGGVYQRSGRTHCDWNGDDFVCEQTQRTKRPFGTLVSKRRFELFTKKPLPLLTSYAPHAGTVAEAAQLETDLPILVDAIGFLAPIARIGSARIFATADREDALTARFFLYENGRIVSTNASELTDELREPPERSKKEPDPIPLTRVSDLAKFRATRIGSSGESQLLQVLLQSGGARSLFWLAIDPASYGLAAMRVASTAREGESRTRGVPASIAKYRFLDRDDIAVTVYGEWGDDVWVGAECGEPNDEDSDTFDGVIEWSPSGFATAFVERAQNPFPPQVTIAADGKLGTAPRYQHDMP
jgi:hypothetical protein